MSMKGLLSVLVLGWLGCAEVSPPAAGEEAPAGGADVVAEQSAQGGAVLGEATPQRAQDEELGAMAVCEADPLFSCASNTTCRRICLALGLRGGVCDEASCCHCLD
jgi:hypothetical protein